MGANRNLIATLQRIASPQRNRVRQETCEFCSTELLPEHRHLLEAASRNIICACDGCALRFQSVVGGRFKLIPRDARELPEFCLTDAQWDSLALPIQLAFFFRDSASGKMTALYPSPAGATESLLSLENWLALERVNPALTEMEPEVEALLVNRAGKAREHFIAPIDRCYGLVGLIRTHWRGFSGGEVVWQEIESFFSNLRQKAGVSRELPEASHA